MAGEAPQAKPLKFRAIGPIVKAAGLGPWAIMFLALFLAASALTAVYEPDIGGFANAAWLMFQVVTTIGLGDYTCVSLVGRASAILLSIYSVFFLALITGAVVSFCTETMQMRRDESVAHFLSQLEHLPDLSHEELVELSEKVKKIERTRL